MNSTSNNTGSPSQLQPEARRRFGRLRRLINDEGRRQRLLFLLSLTALLVVTVLGGIVRSVQVLPFDLAATLGIQEIHVEAFRQLMVVVSIFGRSPWSAVTVGAGVLLVGVLLGWKDGAYLLLVTLLQGLANLAIKLAIGRSRPVDTLVEVFVPESGNSFPSGHVMFYTVFFGMLCFLAWLRLPRSWGRAVAMTLTGGLVCLVGPSRIFLGAHWLSDVIAAHLLGLIMLLFGIEFYLASLAPRSPGEQGGLVGQQDQAASRAEPT